MTLVAVQSRKKDSVPGPRQGRLAVKRLSGMLNELTRKAAGQPVVARLAEPLGVLSAWLPLDLTHSGSTNFINLELTSRCNLRCVYCSKSFSADEKKRSAYDFPEEWIEPSMRMLHRRGLWKVSVQGIGETTVRKGWQDICRSFLDAGLNLMIISNFGRELTTAEIAVLARFGSIEISVDTADPKLFARIRRGARLETLLTNIERVRAYARFEGVREPEFFFSSLITDKTIFGVEELVLLGLAHGVKCFYFSDLSKGPDIEGCFNVYNVATLPRAELIEGLACLDRASELANQAGCQVEYVYSLRDNICAALNGARDRCELSESARGFSSRTPGVSEGMTRNCTMPWGTTFLCADGEVRLCCASDHLVGDLREETLEEIVNGPKIRQFRQNLLTGHLEGSDCMHCCMQAQIPIGEFRRQISGRLILWSLRRCILNLWPGRDEYLRKSTEEQRRAA